MTKKETILGYKCVHIEHEKNGRRRRRVKNGLPYATCLHWNAQTGGVGGNIDHWDVLWVADWAGVLYCVFV